MPKGIGGVRIEELRVGAGTAATRRDRALIHYELTLNHGERVRSTREENQPEWIRLARRDDIAGLRYGIEGMRVGGIRRVRVPPTLAYRDRGVPGTIPSAAVLVFEIELLDVIADEPGAFPTKP